MKVMEFAIATKKDGFCINARSPYVWTDCGKIKVQNDASEADVERAKREAGIPDEALCVKAYNI